MDPNTKFRKICSSIDISSFTYILPNFQFFPIDISSIFFYILSIFFIFLFFELLNKLILIILFLDFI